MFYFFSNGNWFMGGFDVFVFVCDENGVWLDLINFGYLLNLVGDDLFYMIIVDGGIGYLILFRCGGKGEKDIYEVKNDYLNLDNVVVLKGCIKIVNDCLFFEGVYVILCCFNCGNFRDFKIYLCICDGVFLSLFELCC